jgi:hypothetical protein
VGHDRGLYGLNNQQGQAQGPASGGLDPLTQAIGLFLRAGYQDGSSR